MPLIWAAVLLFASLTAWIGYRAGQSVEERSCKKRVADYRKDIHRLKKRLKEMEEEKRHLSFLPPVKEKKSQKKSQPPAHKSRHDLSEIRDYKQASAKSKANRPVKVKPSGKFAEPELVIIIDDVAWRSQLAAIQKLPFRVTPSIFPPAAGHPDTPKMAERLKHFMIHLPMEAIHFDHPEKETLSVKDDRKRIARRLYNIRRWFPRARFINNHTGSRFTSDPKAMERFMAEASKQGYLFVDSRTTPGTVVPKVCKKFGQPYLARDIFLDNRPDKQYILDQLKKAVATAKKHGYAVAIGHPHETTIEALADAKKILAGVKVVYIDELYDRIEKNDKN